jgi:hypothetical protein
MLYSHYFILVVLVLIIHQNHCAPIGSDSSTSTSELELDNIKRQIYPQQTFGQNQQNFNQNQQAFGQNQQNFNQNQQPPYWQVNSQNPNNLNLVHNNQYWPGPDPQLQQQQQQYNQNQQGKAYVYPLKPVFPEFVTTTTTTTTTEHPPETVSQNPDDVPLYSKSFNPYDRETVRATPLTPQALWYSRYADLTVPIAAVPFNTWNNI